MNQILKSLDDFKLKSLDHLPIVSDIIDKLKIVEIIDKMCPDSERFDISPGTVVKAFILSILSGKRALYKISDFLNDYPIKQFFKSDIDPKKFTDDRLASVLDILYKNGLENIYSQIVIEVIKRYRLKINFIHSDTSSIKLQGAYEGFSEGPQPMYGYSKDHRPDLKQINFGLSMSNIEKLPLTFKMDSGNLSDNYFNDEQTKNLSKLSSSLNLLDSTIIGDCKFFNKKSIGLCNSVGFKFLTLVPDNFSEKSILIKKACTEAKLEVILDKKNSRGIQLCKYEGISYNGDLFCILPNGKSKKLKVKYLVLKSYNLSKSKEKSLLRAISKERKFLNQAKKSYLKKRFSCVKDLEKDFKKFVKTHKIIYHNLDYEIEEKEVYVKSKKRGRPKKDFKRETVKEFIIKLSISNLELDGFEDLGYLVLCTDNLNLSDREILLRYKEQYSVEGGIRWMKCDKQLSPIFLKTPKRINGMCMLYILSLLINNLIQWQVRKHLSENGEKIPGNNNVLTEVPTCQVIFEKFKGLKLLEIKVNELEIFKVNNFNELQEKILSILEINKNVYFQ